MAPSHRILINSNDNPSKCVITLKDTSVTTNFVLTRILLCTILIATFSCDKEDQRIVPVRFAYQLVNEDGNAATQFAEGENLIFQFLIINGSGYSIYFQGLETEDFLKVYKRNELNEYEAVGKPYENMFCNYVGGFPLAEGDTLKIIIPWIPADTANYHHFCNLRTENMSLDPAKYRADFSTSVFFSIGEETYNIPASDAEIYFQVN